tara:strand:+ start:264 stop:926 length:663 start_codon:yes stop_codon:yes gene_type:complete
MTLKEQIRIALGIDKPETKLGYQDKLIDGTIITSEADELVEGSDVSVLTEDGTTIPLPVGEYETETGIKFRVDEEGVIAEVYTEEETEEETPSEEETPEEEVEVEATEETRLPKKVKETTEVEFEKETIIAELSDAVKEMLSGMQTQIDEIRDLVEGNNTTADEEIVSLSKQVAELKKAPATTPENMSKFSKSNTQKSVSKSEYRNMSQKEKYWYNINKN